VIGAGSVGCLAAWLLARMPGCEVELVDINPRRRNIAAALGVAFAAPQSARAEADVLLHTSGSEAGLALALRLAAFEATVCELSWYGKREVTLALGEGFHSRRLVLKSSQVGALAATRRSRWDHRRRLRLALSLLSAPVLDQLINSEGSFESLPDTMAQLARAPGEVIMHRVIYGAARA
jgi:threonine dehydrogenase-like Zn-dependent dehydrogenase